MSATPVPTVAAPTTGADPRVSATSAAATDRSVGFRRRATAVAMVVGAAGLAYTAMVTGTAVHLVEAALAGWTPF